MAKSNKKKSVMIFGHIARLRKRTPRDRTVYLTTLPNEIIDRISYFLDGPDKAALAVTCSRLYLSLQYDLSKLPAWEAIECSRRLKRAGYFKRQQLPCFSCFEMHQMSHFYSPELHHPLPQCISQSRMWRCACNSVTAQEIQVAVQLDPKRTTPRANDIRDLFDPCESCHDDEGLSCTGTEINGPTRATSVIHVIKFLVPHIGVDTAVLRDAIAARSRSFDLPLCRHLSLSDPRVLAAFDPSCLGMNAGCPATCRRRMYPDHVVPLTSCPMGGCGLSFGIAHEYFMHGENWQVVLTISRQLPSFTGHLKGDRAWSSLAFTEAELAVGLPAMPGKVRGRDELTALVWSLMVREGSWEYERRMLRQFWRTRGRGWVRKKEGNGEDGGVEMLRRLWCITERWRNNQQKP